MTEERKNKTISGISTALIIAIGLVICALVGFKYPDPPIPEEGVEVNLGNSDMGLGTAEQPDVSPSRVPPTPPSNAGEKIAQQNTEATEQIDAADDHNNSSDNTVQPTKEEPKEPVINQNALFKKRNKEQGGSEGISQGTGNQGKEGGNPASTRYDGEPGEGGIGWNLAGRGVVGKKPRINYESNEQGTNVVRIWVDRNGRVVRAEPNQRGTTLPKPYFANKAKEAAMQFHFTANPDAPETQIGTVTVRFATVN